MQQVQGPPPVRAVTIPFADLKDRSKDLSGKIEEGLGRQGLGSVPGYPELRKRLLRLAPRLVNLPDDVKKELEDPDSRYFFGWSHGKEKLENGIWDTFKGSYFANPVFDVPTADDVLVTRYPSYCRPNIWPMDHLPEFEVAFKDLGKLMLEVGLMLAHHCDSYVLQQGVQQGVGESLEQILARSRCPKGRLLYYFPKQFSKENDGVQSVSTWCGWHTDYGTLTGLTCVVKVIFEDDELAYQIGETAEILSRGHLCATPHCVKAPSSENASDVDRSTFVLFIQPDWDEKLKLPSEMPYHQELIPPKAEGYTLTYGEYSERVADKYFEARA
ncbi:unnamed protein product [Urochloa decumbens]|uniref:Fe2OG dioxygenase domain-containing protein n=1 Tax=Urochloa decumbens TaxID=240449 RepID=A0ABC8VQ32_9POAL